MRAKSLYGFSSDLEPFAGKDPAEQAQILRSWGCSVVFGGYKDPSFVDAAHRAGLSVYAEFGCFAGERWWQQMPLSRPVTAEGKQLEAEGGYCGVNPSVPEVRRAQLQALERLLSDYPLDGVWLDFIRWPCHWEVPSPSLPRTSFDPDTLARFRHDTGIAVPIQDPPRAAKELYGSHKAAWTTWRCQQITDWAAEARAVVERVRPGALLGLFGVPWRLEDHSGAILGIIGQDYRALGAHVDVFSPMVYHRMCGHPPRWIADVVREIHSLTGKPVWPIVQSVDEPAPLPAGEYGAALDVALHASAAEGVLVYNMKGALAADKLAVTRAKFGPGSDPAP